MIVFRRFFYEKGDWMKLFLREHLLLIAVQVVQFTLIALIMWLAGFHNISLILYSIFIGLFLFVCYLLYYYFSRRNFYQRLSMNISSLEEAQVPLGNAPLTKRLSELLQGQYRLYEEKLLKLEAKQEEHLIFLDRWIHQMKTPLSVIDLTAQELDEPVATDLRAEVDRLKEGLNTVLHMARLRSLHQDFHVKKVNLPAIVQAVNQDNKRYYIRNDVYPHVTGTNTPIFVESDEKWLYFIITQIVQNAIKYSTGISKQIRLSIFERGTIVVLEIADAGIGIPQHDLKRIFAPFFTGENGRKYRESTGVGLYLVKEVATYLGHQVEVESEVGKGTVFRIVFSRN